MKYVTKGIHILLGTAMAFGLCACSSAAKSVDELVSNKPEGQNGGSFGVTETGTSQEEKNSVQGYYEAVYMKSGEDVYEEEDLASLREYGMDFCIELYEDGTGVMKVIDDEYELTYDPKTGMFRFDDEEEGSMTLEGDEITIRDDDDLIIFRKAEKPQAEADPLLDTKRVGHEGIGYFNVPKHFEEETDYSDAENLTLTYSADGYALNVFSMTKEEMEGDEDLKDPVYVMKLMAAGYEEDYAEEYDRTEYFYDEINGFDVQMGDIYFNDGTRLTVSAFLDQYETMHVVITETLYEDNGDTMDELLWVVLSEFSADE